MGKGEIALYEQFLLFPQCFQKMYVVDASKRESMSKGLHCFKENKNDSKVDNGVPVSLKVPKLVVAQMMIEVSLYQTTKF